MLTSKEILSKSECSRKDIFKSFKSDGDYPISTKVEIAVINFVKTQLKQKPDGTFNVTDFKLDEKEFDNHELYQAHYDRAINCLFWFVGNYRDYFDKIQFDVMREVDINGTKVLLTCDMSFVDKNGKRRCVNLYFKKPKLTRSGKSRAENSKEVMLLWLLAKEISRNVDSFGEIYYFIPREYTLSKTSVFSASSQVFLHNFKGCQPSAEDIISKVIEARECKDVDCRNCKYSFFCDFKEEVKAQEIKEQPEEKKVFGVDKNQRDVCLFTKGIARVIAGPGSGKTKTITSRVSYLCSEGVKPNEFLLFTFTNAAADEMRTRITQALKLEGIPFKEDKLLITTFHGLGFKIISENYKDFGYSEAPKQINKTEKYRMLKNVYDETWDNLTLDQKKFLISDCQGLNPVMSNRFIKGFLNLIEEDIRKIKERLIYVDEDFVLDDQGFIKTLNLCRGLDVLRIFYENYKEYLKKNNLVDYDDLIALPLISEEHSKKITGYIKGIKHVMVDEFQDSNPEQMKIIKALTKGPKFESLMVVGDPSQAIYGFQGTSPENFNDFDLYVDGEITDFILSNNYRSTKEIIDVSEIIENSQVSYTPKHMLSQKSGDLPVYVAGYPVGKNLAYQILKETKETEFKDIAVIGRTRKALKNIEADLSSAGIPFVYGINEEVSMNTFLVPVCEFGKALVSYNEDGYLQYLAMTGDIELTSTKEEIEEKIESLREEVNKNLVYKDNFPTNESVKEVFSKLIERIRDKRLLGYLKDKEKEYAMFADFLSYLEEAVLYGTDEILEPINDGKNAVTLVTAHSAKGKEWKNVHVLTDDFKISVQIEPETVRERDEELRVLYVSATRAKERLSFYGYKNGVIADILLSEIGKIKAV